MNLLLNRPDVSVNFSDPEYHQTALMYAAYHGHAHIVNALIGRYDLQVNRMKKNDVTALMIACRHGHVAVVELVSLTRIS